MIPWFTLDFHPPRLLLQGTMAPCSVHLPRAEQKSPFLCKPFSLSHPRAVSTLIFLQLSLTHHDPGEATSSLGSVAVRASYLVSPHTPAASCLQSVVHFWRSQNADVTLHSGPHLSLGILKGFRVPLDKDQVLQCCVYGVFPSLSAASSPAFYSLFPQSSGFWSERHTFQGLLTRIHCSPNRKFWKFYLYWFYNCKVRKKLGLLTFHILPNIGALTCLVVRWSHKAWRGSWGRGCSCQGRLAWCPYLSFQIRFIVVMCHRAQYVPLWVTGFSFN